MGTVRQSPPSPELKTFSDRLKKAMAFKKIDAAALAKDSEYKPNDISRLLAGMREPSMKRLMLLANSLGCSVDYLLGLAPKPQRASVVVEVDVDALKPQSSECGQTSGQISGEAGRLAVMAAELPDFDVELLVFIAKFLIERKEKGLLKFVKIVRQTSKKETEKASPIKTYDKEAKGGLGDCNLAFDDDDFDEDELCDDADDGFGKEESDNEDFEDDDDFDDDCFDG